MSKTINVQYTVFYENFKDNLVGHERINIKNDSKFPKFTENFKISRIIVKNCLKFSKSTKH